ncbi:hypothetical protein E1B28_002904 [Marasmius oreades]|uniref:Uncharacterized protein n=1 Tax=Marasmius oreades TaxID=181124 RepID=A0A9P7UJS3_9AGAR|nr:uncharacterized protein E1B28_002904 [Marasmius oreades]KAG7085338.1 hypothetical protein E1B28_002904 [Marasmius oreades]
MSSTNTILLNTQDSLLSIPMPVDIGETTITPVMLANPYCTNHVRKEALTFIESRSSLDTDSMALLKALDSSISNLQAIIDEKNKDIENFKQDIKIRDIRIEVGKKISELHRKAVIEEFKKAKRAGNEVLGLKQAIEFGRHELVRSSQEILSLKQEVSVL